jgi:hypothetical protein
MVRVLIIVAFAVMYLRIDAFGDQPLSEDLKFSSPSGEYVLKKTENSNPDPTWKLRNNDTGKLLYEIKGDRLLGYKTVLISNSGRFITVIDTSGYREQTNDLNRRVISFFADGTLSKEYTLKDIFEDTSNVSVSITRYEWLFGNSIRHNDETVSIKTLEETVYEFKVETGEIQTKALCSLRDEGAVYVYGKVNKLNGNKYEIDIYHRVWGCIPDSHKIVFNVDPSSSDAIYNDGGIYSCIILDEKLVRITLINFNLCNLENVQALPTETNLERKQP